MIYLQKWFWNKQYFSFTINVILFYNLLYAAFSAWREMTSYIFLITNLNCFIIMLFFSTALNFLSRNGKHENWVVRLITILRSIIKFDPCCIFDILRLGICSIFLKTIIVVSVHTLTMINSKLIFQQSFGVTLWP